MDIEEAIEKGRDWLDKNKKMKVGIAAGSSIMAIGFGGGYGLEMDTGLLIAMVSGLVVLGTTLIGGIGLSDTWGKGKSRQDALERRREARDVLTPNGNMGDSLL